MKRLFKVNGKRTTAKYRSGYANAGVYLKKHGMANTRQMVAATMSDPNKLDDYDKGFIAALQDLAEIAAEEL